MALANTFGLQVGNFLFTLIGENTRGIYSGKIQGILVGNTKSIFGGVGSHTENPGIEYISA